MRYTAKKKPRHWPKRVIILAVIGTLLVVGVTVAVRQMYFSYLKPVTSSQQEAQLITIAAGSTVDEIAKQLEDAGLIRSAWAFRLYVSSKEVRNALQAGTYSLDASMSVPEIVALLTHGKIATGLVTILPGQRLDQIRQTLIDDGFSESDVDAALNPMTYDGHPALVDKPATASLEGYLYPDSFQKAEGMSAQTVVSQSLDQMQKYLTPDLREAFAAQSLSTYQGIILSSIVEQEAANQSDREQVAQVYLKRLRIGMKLDADPTAYYGARLDGAPLRVGYPSVYNTYQNAGLPPTPISNVSASSLRAVANPAKTDWLYFVAGDDGITHFSRTLAEHEAATAKYCTKICRPQ